MVSHCDSPVFHEYIWFNFSSCESCLSFALSEYLIKLPAGLFSSLLLDPLLLTRQSWLSTVWHCLNPKSHSTLHPKGIIYYTFHRSLDFPSLNLYSFHAFCLWCPFCLPLTMTACWNPIQPPRPSSNGTPSRELSIIHSVGNILSLFPVLDVYLFTSVSPWALSTTLFA